MLGEEVLSPRLPHTSETHLEAGPQTLEDIGPQNVVSSSSWLETQKPQKLVRDGESQAPAGLAESESAF